MLLTIISVIAGLLPALLKAFGVNDNLDNLTVSLVTAVGELFAGFKSNKPVTATLTELQSVLATLAADTSLDPTILEDVSEGISDLSAAIAAYQQAEITTDPSTLTPIPPVA